MRAAVLKSQGTPLEIEEVEIPKPGPKEVLLKVLACGVCRTDLHIVDGDLKEPKLPLILGHQIVGRVVDVGEGVTLLKKGDRVGVPWLGEACGSCAYCREGKENLCDLTRYTGYQLNGGFAEYCVARAAYTFPIPAQFSDTQAAPLLCAGLIGFRALRMTQKAQKIGFYGFGSSAHILTQVVKFQGGEVYAFTRPEDIEKQEFAKKLGAVWAGSSEEAPPRPLDAAILFAPIGDLVPTALKAVRKGGVVVCAGIHMSDIPSFPYSLIWEERVLRSVANLTRKDGEDFLPLAAKIPIQSEVQSYALDQVNQALSDLRVGNFSGSAVIILEEEKHV